MVLSKVLVVHLDDHVASNWVGALRVAFDAGLDVDMGEVLDDDLGSVALRELSELLDVMQSEVGVIHDDVHTAAQEGRDDGISRLEDLRLGSLTVSVCMEHGPQEVLVDPHDAVVLGLTHLLGCPGGLPAGGEPTGDDDLGHRFLLFVWPVFPDVIHRYYVSPSLCSKESITHRIEHLGKTALHSPQRAYLIVVSQRPYF
jgi:hypothetical protein